jgi:hypothetical protein
MILARQPGPGILSEGPVVMDPGLRRDDKTKIPSMTGGFYLKLFKGAFVSGSLALVMAGHKAGHDGNEE